MPNYFLKSLIKKTFCHYLPGDMEGGGIMKKVTNGDGGLEFGIFAVTSFLKPLSTSIHRYKYLKKQKLGSFPWNRVLYFKQISFENDVMKSSKVSRFFKKFFLVLQVLYNRFYIRN